MSILYIRHPSKAATESAAPGAPLLCPFALTSDGGAVEREGVSALADLSLLLSGAKRVVVLVAASDVSILRVQVPPMSPAKIKMALPNLVEDQLMSDPSDCVVVATSAANGADGLRSVAVVDQAWLEYLDSTLSALGARDVEAIPAQLCLPFQDGVISVAVSEESDEVDLTLRLSEQDGIGLPVLPEDAEQAANEVMQSLRAIVPSAVINLYVPQARVGAYQEAADEQVTVSSDNWPRWIAGARANSLNLMASLAVNDGSQFDWQRWRWPLVLACIVLIINTVGLNIEWWRMKTEASALREVMLKTFKSAYPKQTTIVNPVAQMKQQIAAAKQDSGQSTPDAFLSLLGNFGEAGGNILMNGRTASAVSGIEYRDHSLLIRLKPDVDLAATELKAALTARGLSFTQPTAGVLQIRSGK